MAAAAAAAAQRLLAASTKIIGVGRNYVAHAKELGNPVPKEPLLFLKPTSSFLHAGVAGAAIEVPGPVESLHHEVELAVVLSQRARDVPEASAMDFVGGYALALDMTAREFQSAAKPLYHFLPHCRAPPLPQSPFACGSGRGGRPRRRQGGGGRARRRRGGGGWGRRRRGGGGCARRLRGGGGCARRGGGGGLRGDRAAVAVRGEDGAAVAVGGEDGRAVAGRDDDMAAVASDGGGSLLAMTTSTTTIRNRAELEGEEKLTGRGELERG
nr:putative fumarylacetoacetate hydrolase family protein [Oryza sativa Japonica Group]ABF96673.1 fumarylacetoacetate hydrolase family protein [Oryza sativa Japonica Group]